MAVVATARAGMQAAGRATVLQLRNRAMTAAMLHREALELVGSSPVPVIVSSRCDIAIAAGAAGVNLPGPDIAVHDARALMGGDRLVGRSVHSLEAALAAERDGADYVIFGPVWPSATHPGAEATGIARLAEVARALRIEVVAIGGVTEERVAEVASSGAAGYAAIRLFQ